MRPSRLIRFIVCFVWMLGLCLAWDIVSQASSPHTTHYASNWESKAPNVLNSQKHSARLDWTGLEIASKPAIWQRSLAQNVGGNDALERAIYLSQVALSEGQQGNWREANAAISESIELLQFSSQTASPDHQAALAQVLAVQGELQFNQGQFSEAAQSWSDAAIHYQALGQVDGEIQSRLAQASAWQSLGLYSRASAEILAPLTQRIKALPDNSLSKLDGLLRLGQSQMVVGSLDEALQILRTTLPLAQGIPSPEAAAAAQLNLANVLYAQVMDGYHRGSLKESEQEELAAKQTEAIEFYQQIQSSAPDRIDRLRAMQNQAGLILDTVPFLQEIHFNRNEPRSLTEYSDAQLQAIEEQIPRLNQAEQLTQQAQTQLSQLPPSRSSFNIQINLAYQQLKVHQQWVSLEEQLAQERFELERLLYEPDPALDQPVDQLYALDLLEHDLPLLERRLASYQVDLQFISQYLGEAQQLAEQLNDIHSQSYFYGIQANLAEAQGDLGKALAQTNEAILLASKVDAPDMLYRWYGQWGRLLEQSGDEKGAIAAYRSAIQTLQELRTDLTAVNPEVLFSFRRNIEPLYQQLMGLILRTSGGNPDQSTLNEIRDLAELLSIEELSDYLQTDCLQLSGEILQSNRISIEELPGAAQTAFIYPILLSSQLAVITSFPTEGERLLKLYAVDLPEIEVKQITKNFRKNLLKRHSLDFKNEAEQLYDWLIRPMESDLKGQNVDTLVFVSDQAFRNIPMATLFDGEHYLIENYKLATTPGLRLTSTESLQAEDLSVLAFGLTKEKTVQLETGEQLPFSPLPAVQQELDQIVNQFPSTKPLFNEDFGSDRFASEVDQSVAPVVHLATHGQFSSDRRETFLVTWDDQALGLRDFTDILQVRDTLRKAPLNLLVLSACETATGDEKAALGLAGVALQSGARSTLASLWQVSDEATSLLMKQFYKELAKGDVTKAEALRSAQIQVLRDELSRGHPYFWAPFILVGNWV